MDFQFRSRLPGVFGPSPRVVSRMRLTWFLEPIPRRTLPPDVEREIAWATELLERAGNAGRLG